MSENRIPQCKICQIGNDSEEQLEVVNRWLAEGKTYKWILNQAKTAWDLDISESSLRRHSTRGHLPERYAIAREAIELALKQDFEEMQIANVAALTLIREAGFRSLLDDIAAGDTSKSTPSVTIQAVKELQNILGENKIIFKTKVLPPEVLRGMLEAIGLFVPPQRQLELRAYLDEHVRPLLPDSIDSDKQPEDEAA